MSVAGVLSPEAPLFDDEARSYDALLVMSFGGPEGPDDVMPFLENVTRGRNVPRQRLDEVATHYRQFGGVSPINAQNRALIAALEAELEGSAMTMPVYFGNRNWHPFVADTLRRMRDDGVKRALAFFTSAFSSYSGCRQYREDILRASEQVEGAPEIDKIRAFYNHPGFVEASVAALRAALARFAEDRRSEVHVCFTAHSVPLAMARGCDYERQLGEAARLVAGGAGVEAYDLVYQSRSGPPQVPWLGPDVLEHMEHLHGEGVRELVLHPIGFLSDHMEVKFDLDTEAAEKARELGMSLVRAATVGTHPAFVRAIRELIVERLTANPERPALGGRGPNHDVCPVDCCLPGTRAHGGRR